MSRFGNSFSDPTVYCYSLGRSCGFSFLNYKMGRILVSITMGYDDSAIMLVKHLPRHINSRLFLTPRFGHHLRVACLLTSRTRLPTCQAPHRFSPLLAAPAQFSEGSQLRAERRARDHRIPVILQERKAQKWEKRLQEPQGPGSPPPIGSTPAPLVASAETALQRPETPSPRTREGIPYSW